MNTLHMKDRMHSMHMPHFHKPHVPTCHQMVLKTEHLLKDPRFWAVLAMVAVTALVITMAILTKPSGPTPQPISPNVFGPYLY